MSVANCMPVYFAGYTHLHAGTEEPSRSGPSPFTSVRECLEANPLVAVVARNNDALLSAEARGRNTLISRIVAVVKVCLMPSVAL